MIWISQQYPELFRNIANVQFPSTENLRAAGMIPVRLDAYFRDAVDEGELRKDHETGAGEEGENHM
jgi:hypothetical protein